MVVTFVIAVSLYMALTTSRVFVFLFESGLEKAKYSCSQKTGSSAIPESLLAGEKNIRDALEAFRGALRF